MANRRGRVEIFKDYSELLTEENYDDLENTFVSDEELETIKKFCPIIKIYNDTASELTAFHLKCDDETADEIVDALNEINEDDGEWYVGDEQDEYVYVDNI